MADNIPVFNQAVANMANMLDDPASGADNGIQAATNGLWLTATKKTAYMNEALRWIVTEMVQRYGMSAAGDRLQGAITALSFTMSASGTTLDRNYMYPLTVFISGTGDSFNYGKRQSLDTDFMPSLSNFFLIEAGKIYVYQRSAGTLTVKSSGSATLYYLKADRVDTSTGADVAANTTPDTTIDRWALDACVLYAAGRACIDKSIIDSSPEWADKGNRFTAQAYLKLPKQ